MPLALSDTLGGKKKERANKQINQYEEWENRQIMNWGIVSRRDQIEDGLVSWEGFTMDHEMEEDYEVEVTDKEPNFLVNQTWKSGV